MSHGNGSGRGNGNGNGSKSNGQSKRDRDQSHRREPPVLDPVTNAKAKWTKQSQVCKSFIFALKGCCSVYNVLVMSDRKFLYPETFE